MTPVPDRIEQLLAQTAVTGIDFVYVHADQVTLDVHFLLPPAVLVPPLAGPFDPARVRIYHPEGAVPDLALADANLLVDAEGRNVLRLRVEKPGDFALYKLSLQGPQFDPYYNDVPFSFKANCPSDLDCEPPGHECPPGEPVDFPVDYLARDFWSFRRALLDFASLRYPGWPDRLEADAGNMLVEVMSALGDEMAYYQDRIGREAYLETATQRRSLRRLARLVDYQVHDGLGARAWLDVQVTDVGGPFIPAGTDVWAAGDNGTRIDFEVGQALREGLAGDAYYVTAARNRLQAHRWDEDQVCLPVGATELYVKNHQQLVLVPAGGLPSAEWVLLKTLPANAAQPARNHLVRLTGVTDGHDPVFNAPVTRLVWEGAQALPFELDLTALEVRANLVPATAGRTYAAYFVIGADVTGLDEAGQQALLGAAGEAGVARAVEREGPDGTVTYLFTLPQSEAQNLVWLGDDPHRAQPEVNLQEVQFNAAAGTWDKKDDWYWRRSLVGVYAAQGLDNDYTLEDGSWRRVVGYQRPAGEVAHRDYAGNEGVTIRFGNGAFGRRPAEKTVFRVDYRLGGGRQGNVAAGALRHAAAGWFAVSNPLPAAGGADPETPEEVRQSAPEAFRAVTFRAVRPEDYAEAARRLPWVQQAGASFRWTGSWLSAFVTPDPRGATLLAGTRRRELETHLDRFRQAGRQVHVANPQYADIDLEIIVCVAPYAYPGEVKERVLAALQGRNGVRPVPGYFSPDRFTFGTPLERSTLEATIQEVPGVLAVESIRFRRRGWFEWRPFTEWGYAPGDQAIIRVDNDPLHPERGSFKIHTHGGL